MPEVLAKHAVDTIRKRLDALVGDDHLDGAAESAPVYARRPERLALSQPSELSERMLTQGERHHGVLVLAGKADVLQMLGPVRHPSGW